MNYITISNNNTIPISDIPEINYDSFFDTNIRLVIDNVERHCVNYYGYKLGNKIKLICCIVDDSTHEIYVSSCLVS